MFSALFVVPLIYQSLVYKGAYGKATPFCPSQCRCNEATSTVQSCILNTYSEYAKIIKRTPIENLSMSSCKEKETQSKADTEGYHAISQLTCDTLTLNDGSLFNNCKFTSEKCRYQCQDVDVGVVMKSGKNICACCDPPLVLRKRRNAKKKISADIGTNQNISANASVVYRKGSVQSIIAVGGLSILAFLINFIVMVKLCCSPLTVIDLFATALFLFNVILSLYGLSMAFYVFKPELQKYTWYCQFFTSIKLFSLGSALYTMVFLIFHRPIRRSSGEPGRDDSMEEGKKKAAKRDAIFKGIVFLLEAVMLAGVLGVLSWIKTDNWRDLCVIITPMGSVDGLLHGIEVWYYTLSGFLVSWYFGNYIYRQYRKIKEYREKLKQQDDDDDEMGNGVCDEPDTPEIAPYIIRDFPIFVLVALSFTIWLAGYIITLPSYNFFSTRASPTVRVCSLLLPLILQPLIYIIRETWVFKCPCFRSGKHRTNTVEEIKLNKSPSDESQTSQEASNNNLELTQFDNIAAQPPIARVEQTDQSDDDDATEKDPLNKKTKNRSNDFEVPKVVCRSPQPVGERTRLLDDVDGQKTSPPTIIVGGEDATMEKTDLINGEGDLDMNGRVSRGPTFYPIADKANAAGGGTKQVELKSYTPIKEEKIAEEFKQMNNNGKEKRKDDKKKQMNSTGSLDAHSDSSSSHEDAPQEVESIPDSRKSEWDPNKFEAKISPQSSPTELTKIKNEINKPNNINNNNNNNNNNNSDIGQIIANNTDVGEVTSISSGPKSEANHTGGKRLKKPVLTRDNSGSVER